MSRGQVAVGEQFLVLGGWDTDADEPRDLVEACDTSTGKWTTLPHMPVLRGAFAAAAVC